MVHNRENTFIIYKNIPIFSLVLFGETYAFFCVDQVFHYFFYYALIIPLSYWAGYTLADREDDQLKSFRKIFYAIVIGLEIHILLNAVTNVGVARNFLTDFFSGEYVCATGAGSLSTIILATAAYWLITEKTVVVKIIGTVCILLSLRYGLLIGTRTQFIILGICFVICTFVYLVQKGRLKGAISFAVICLLICLLSFYTYSHNWFGLKTLIDASNLADRFSAIHGDSLKKADSYRISSIPRGFVTLFEHPFGGLISETYYHNTWLDIGRVAGIFPFIFWLIYTAVEFAHMISIVKKRFICAEFRILLLGLYLGIYLNMFVEPGMEGFRWLIYTFAWIGGMVDCIYYRICIDKTYVNKLSVWRSAKNAEIGG